MEMSLNAKVNDGDSDNYQGTLYENVYYVSLILYKRIKNIKCY